VSTEVSEQLIEYGSEDVIEALVRNENAELSQASIDYLVGESRTVDRFQEPLLNRNDLSFELAHKMYWWVWDTGIGISEGPQELVFEKFHQDRGHIYSRKEEGTGLGLHISKHLAKQMGGDIVLKSEVDKGSEFIVLLPISI
jgi:signal transduction histidine kinase